MPIAASLRLNPNSSAVARARAAAPRACSRARLCRFEVTTATTRKNTSVVTFDGSAMTRLYSGGRKKKLTAKTLSSEAKIDGPSP